MNIKKAIIATLTFILTMTGCMSEEEQARRAKEEKIRKAMIDEVIQQSKETCDNYTKENEQELRSALKYKTREDIETIQSNSVTVCVGDPRFEELRFSNREQLDLMGVYYPKKRILSAKKNESSDLTEQLINIFNQNASATNIPKIIFFEECDDGCYNDWTLEQDIDKNKNRAYKNLIKRPPLKQPDIPFPTQQKNYKTMRR